MIKLIKISSFLVFISLSVQAQFGVSANVGLGSYAMSDMKNFNKAYQHLMKSAYNLDVYQLENFPIFRTFSFESFYADSNRFRISLGYTYLTSGSRLYNEDYSGKISQDIIVGAQVIDLKISRNILSNYINIDLFFSPQIFFCKNEFINSLTIYPDHFEHDNTTAYSYNIGASSGFAFRKRFKKIEFNIELGYYLDIYKGVLKTNINGTKYEMKNPESNSPLENDWRGFRLSLGTSYWF